MIRQGLRVMAQRSPVEIGEILDCKNGEEALEILRGTEVDVMFTDVRMPNMDGITLVQRLQTLPHPPLTVIISGYDDFSYAVEALRCGAKEYLLKPVEREDISQVLQRLEGMLQDLGNVQTSLLPSERPPGSCLNLGWKKDLTLWQPAGRSLNPQERTCPFFVWKTWMIRPAYI